jgi:hypothetical protein
MVSGGRLFLLLSEEQPDQGRMLMQILWMVLVSLALVVGGVLALAVLTRVLPGRGIRNPEIDNSRRG